MGPHAPSRGSRGSNVTLGGKKYGMAPKIANFIKSMIHPSINKLSVRIFGSEKAVMKERERCQNESFLIIHPFSMFRITWDFVMLCVLLVNLVLLPIAITFFDEEQDSAGLHWSLLSNLTDAVFIADLALNFRTAYFPSKAGKTNSCILSARHIALYYLRTWFFMDFFSSVPFDHVITLVDNVMAGNSDGSNGATVTQSLKGLRMLKLAKFLTLLKLLRITRLLKYASQWEEVLNLASVAMRVVNVVGTMLLFAHLNGCIMFLIPRLSDFPAGNWIDNDGIRQSNWREQYSWSLFRAMSHMLGIGYGKQAPGNMQDLWLLMMSMLSGATCYALFIGQATNIIQQLNYSRRLYTEKMKQVEQYMYHRKLPPELQVRIHQYYEYKFKGKMFNENDVLNELNDCLRKEVLNYNCRELVGVVPFFKDADPAFVSAVVSKLQFEVYQPGDCVIQEGTLGSKMYFIQTGSVDVIISDGTCVAQLSEGSYFGEICLLAKVRRTATIKAETFCNMYSLDQADFSQVLNEFPQMRETMETVARERLDKLGKAEIEFAHKGDIQEFNTAMIKTINAKLDHMLQMYGIEWTPGSPGRSTSLDVHSSPLAESNSDMIQEDPNERKAESSSNQNATDELNSNSKQPEISFVEISDASEKVEIGDTNEKLNSADLKVGTVEKQTRFSVDSCEEIFRNLDISKIDNDETIV